VSGPTIVYHGPTITPVSKEAMGNGTINGANSAAWPAANRAIFFPFWIAHPYPVARLFWCNGATVSGNVDCGIYSADGTKILSTGSTAQATINVVQSVAASLLLTPGSYHAALAVDNATATMFANTPGSGLSSMLGMAQQASAFALPATFAQARTATSYCPIFGLTTQAVI
jgi:hypothetical protein